MLDLGDDITQLQSLCAQLGIPLEPRQSRLLCHYCRLLWDHNQRVNLTRHLDYDAFVSRDLIDCMHLSRLLAPDERILDMGSGGGVPGLVIAILRPDVEVTLSESIRKKAAILEQMVAELEIPVSVAACRAEELLEAPGTDGSPTRFNSVTARAVGPLPKILRWFEGQWAHLDRLLLIKGPRWVAERAEARHSGLLRTLELRRLVTYDMPGHDGQSVILSIWPK